MSKVKVTENGPYLLSGAATVTRFPDGKSYFTLCRCGKSTNKPFCSGAHWNVPFDEDAPKRS